MMKEMTAEPAWIRDCPRRVMIGFHMPDRDQAPEYVREVDEGRAPAVLSAFDAGALVHGLKKAGVQAFYFYNKCHRGNAYYPSRVRGAHVHSAVAERGDIFGQICEACMEEQIVPLAVYEFSDLRMATDHPDWCHRRLPRAADAAAARAAAGEVDVTDGVQGSETAGPCLHGPYGDFAIAQAVETVRAYPIQGYYVDFLGLFTFGHWVCPYCGPRFRRDLGFEFQGIDRMDARQRARYIRWHYARTTAYIRRMRRAIERVRAGVAFTFNFHGGYAQPGLQTWDMAAGLASFVTGDLFVQRAGPLQVDWKLRGYVAAGGRPAEVLLDSVGSVGGDPHTPKALDSYRAETWTARAVGASVTASLIPELDGSYAREQMALIRKVFTEQAAFESWLDPMQPETRVGVVRSAATLEHLPFDGREPTGAIRHELEFQGWCQALIQQHALWDVVHDHLIDSAYLRRFALVILPQAACLSGAQCRALRAYVADGGRLLATGETSLFNEIGLPRKDFALADLLGVRYRGQTDPALNRMRLTDARLVPEDEWVTDRLAVKLGQCRVSAARGARVMGEAGTCLTEQLSNAFLPSGEPGAVWHRAGKGATLYFAGGPGMHYRMFGADTWRRLMQAAVALMGGTAAPVALDAPGSVGLYVHRQPRAARYVVNLVNWVPDLCRLDGRVGAGCDGLANEHYARFGEVARMPPVSDAVLCIRPPRGQSIRRVYLAPDRRPLRFTAEGRGVRIRVPRFDVHAMVVAEWGRDA